MSQMILDFNAFVTGKKARTGQLGDSPTATFDAFYQAATENPSARLNAGWIPPDERTAPQKKANDAILEELPKFTLRGRFTADQRRYPLWKSGKLRYNWQQTGSCVGAGGDNSRKTLMQVEIALKGENEEFKDVFWPYTYGLSRQRGGLRGRGEGSFGPAWAEAARLDGGFETDPAGLPDLPDFVVKGGWLVLPASVELDWSDGAKIGEQWKKVGRLHTIKTAARMRSADDCFEAVANGYPLTLASMFGLRGMVPPVRGSQFPVRVGKWDGEWAHQMFCDEAWDHPELNGILFRIGNNWGPTAHGSPTGDEPTGGFYIEAKTMDAICRNGEVFALSAFDGFVARELNFSAF